MSKHIWYQNVWGELNILIYAALKWMELEIVAQKCRKSYDESCVISNPYSRRPCVRSHATSISTFFLSVTAARAKIVSSWPRCRRRSSRTSGTTSNTSNSTQSIKIVWFFYIKLSCSNQSRCVVAPAWGPSRRRSWRGPCTRTRATRYRDHIQWKNLPFCCLLIYGL